MGACSARQPFGAGFLGAAFPPVRLWRRAENGRLRKDPAARRLSGNILRKVSKWKKFFKLKENGTTFGREIVAGLTTFFAMAYIIVVNPNTLSGRAAGLEEELMPWGAVFLATIIASIIGTLVMGLVANVPYAQAPGMGLNAFFVYTVCLGLGFTWQQTLSMVFICGLINISSP